MATSGATFGRYELLNLLGRGAFGVVYHARDTVLNREVALKILLPHLVTDAEDLERFTAEAQALASLEQIRGEKVGPAADIYALGILTYQLLSGRPPYEGETAHVVYAQVHLLPAPLHEQVPGLPACIYTAVGSALAKNALERPPSA